jgi:hypothetical protein
MIRKLLTITLSAVLVALGMSAITAPASASGSYFVVAKIYFDSPGSDTGSNTSVNGEYFVIKNISSTSHVLTGWTVTDRQSHRYKFGSATLAPGTIVYVHTGMGTNGGRTRYWGLGYYVWNNDGDTASLRGPGGTVQDVCSYTAAQDPVTYC